MQPQSRERLPLTRYVAVAQAVYFIVTGVWPLVSMGTFQKVTGPKTDRWLVKTAGVLITAIGVSLGVAGARQARGPEVGLLGVGSAAGLMGIDVVYVKRGRISPIYLLDAVAEGLLILAWGVAWALGRRGPTETDQPDAA